MKRRPYIGALIAASFGGSIMREETVDIPERGGGDSEWTMDGNGNLVPKDGEAVNVGESRTTARTITLSVPTEFTTVAAALNEIREIRTPPGVKFEILIESGHTFQQGIFAEQEYLGHVTITSEDATVPVDGNLTNPGVGARWLFVGWKGTTLPRLDCLFTGQGVSNDLRGVLYSRMSNGFIEEGAGFEYMDVGISASGHSYVGGVTNGANMIARNMSGSTGRGINLHNATGNFRGTDVSNCGNQGVRMAECAVATLKEINASGCRVGIRATRQCQATAQNANLSGGEQGISIVGCSKVDAIGADVSGGSNSSEIEISSGSIVAAHDCTTTNGTPDVGDTNVSSLNSVESEGIIFA